MENLLEKSDFQFIEIEFLNRCGLSAGCIGSDFSGDLSLPYLEKIVKSELPILKELSLRYNEILHNYNGNTAYAENGRILTRHHFVWARMIVTFYYFYHQDHEFAKKICVLMLDRSASVMIRERIKRGMEMVDEYYKQSQLIEKELANAKKHSNDNHAAELKAQLARIAELETRIKELEAGQQTVKTKKAGRPRQILFEDKIETEQQEKVVALLKEHKLLVKYINCQKENTLNQYLESIYWRWQEIGLVPEEDLLTTAFYHFLHDQCKLKFEISQKSFTNFMGKILRHKEKYPEIWMSVRNEFQKQEA